MIIGEVVRGTTFHATERPLIMKTRTMGVGALLACAAFVTVGSAWAQAPARAPRVSDARMTEYKRVATARPGLVTVDRGELQGFGPKLDAFRNGLGPDDRRTFDAIVTRASLLAVDDASQSITRAPLFEGPAASPDAIAGGIRQALGITPPGRPAPGGKVAIGPKQDDPAPPPPSSKTSIRPKQDDPTPPRPADARAIGPKQDDPGPPPSPESIASLASKLHGFASGLTVDEQATLGWVFERATFAGPSGAVRCYPNPRGPRGPKSGLLALGLRLDQLTGGRWELRPADIHAVSYPIDRPRPYDREIAPGPSGPKGPIPQLGKTSVMPVAPGGLPR
jgi:hypothetical protein